MISSLMTGVVCGQRINFGLYSTDGIVLTPGSVDNLNFNDQQALILPGNTVTIMLTDNTSSVIAIQGRADLDVTVTIDAPASIILDMDNSIPLSVGFAYSNLGAIDESMAKTQAIQIPQGFTSATFPLLRRTAGPPGPPPTPAHNGYTAPTAIAYLFIYGTLGPVPSDASVGLYYGEINIHVEYSTYN